MCKSVMQSARTQPEHKYIFSTLGCKSIRRAEIIMVTEMQCVSAHMVRSYSSGGQHFWPEGRICDRLAAGSPDTVRFMVYVNAVALLSTVGKCGAWKKCARYLAGRMRPAGRSLVIATPGLQYTNGLFRGLTLA